MKKTTLALALMMPAAISQAANIAFISFHSAADDSPDTAALNAGFTRAPDAGYTDLLRGAGHTVTRILSSANPNVALLNTYDLVIISRSVASANYQYNTTTQTGTTVAWNGITAPMMILGDYIARDNRLGYMQGNTIPDVNTASLSLKINEPSKTHPIFNGISLDANSTMINPFATIQTLTYNGTNVTQRGISVVTNPPDNSGTVLAFDNTSTDAANGGMFIAEWLAGTTITHDTGAANQATDTLGGHRLIFLTGSRENGTGANGSAVPADAAGMFDLAPDGQKMFLNAVNYMAVPEPSTYALIALGGGAFLLRRRKA